MRNGDALENLAAIQSQLKQLKYWCKCCYKVLVEGFNFTRDLYQLSVL